MWVRDLVPRRGDSRLLTILSHPDSGINNLVTTRTGTRFPVRYDDPSKTWDEAGLSWPLVETEEGRMSPRCNMDL
jgi:hypothetical protein